MKRQWPRLVIGLLCVALFLGHAARLWQLPFVTQLDAYLYDARVRFFMPGTVDDRVVIVDIDEKSLAEVGRWPWGRNVVAELVRRLVDDYQVAVIGFDVVFAEPDDSSGLHVLENLGKRELRHEKAYQSALNGLRQSLNYDQQLAQTLKGRPVVLGYYFSNAADARKGGALPPPVFEPGTFDGLPTGFFGYHGYGANLPELQAAAAGAGHFNPFVDMDGIVRRVPLLVEHNGAYYESLSLAILRVLMGNPDVMPVFPDPRLPMEYLDLRSAQGRVRIPVDENVCALVPYRGPEASFPYVSAVDVLRGEAPAEVLAGRVILVGTTALGLKDLRSTPVGATYPGVEIHANLIASILGGEPFKEKPSVIRTADAIQVALYGLLLALWLPFLSPIRASLLTVAVLGISLGFNFLMWEGGNLVLPLAANLVLILFLFAFNMSWGYFVESRTKQQFTELFGQYVPPELVDEMARNPESYSMEGRNETLTVLFSDVRNFTSISEGLDPKELTQLMNTYLGGMTEVIRTRRGTLDKYIGDAIMAFWGAPVADPAHARHAVEAALEMQGRIADLSAAFVARGWPALRIGIGINTGVMTVGDMGSPVRKAYTVMGDAVNLASRLEGITKEYGVGIVIGEATLAAVDGLIGRELDRVRVKGKDKPVAIYEPLGFADRCPAAVLDELAQWNAALEDYRACRWAAAGEKLARLRAEHPESELYSLYAQRLDYLRDHPPEAGWDGVTTFKTK